MSESQKRERIEQVLGWSPRPTKVPDDCADGLAPGLVHPGPSFTANFGLQFGYFIEFVEQWKERGPDDRLLDSADAEAAWEFKEFVARVDWRGPLRSSPSNSRAMQQATLLHLVHPRHVRGNPERRPQERDHREVCIRRSRADGGH